MFYLNHAASDLSFIVGQYRAVTVYGLVLSARVIFVAIVLLHCATRYSHICSAISDCKNSTPQTQCQHLSIGSILLEKEPRRGNFHWDVFIAAMMMNLKTR